MLALEVSDHRLDGRSPPQFALDRGRHTAPLLAGVDAHVVGRGCAVAAITFVGDDALDLVADDPLDMRDDGRQRVTIVGTARQRLRRENELTAA